MIATTYYGYIDSPLGQLFVQGERQIVTGLYMPQHKGWYGPEESWQESDAPFLAVRQQMAEYFAGQRQEFDVPLKLAGTPFQRRVWRELTRIPFGKTITYAELAQRIIRPKGSRAVGHANGRNPISILVPCHRVIGAGGKLAGFAGGVEVKRWLLEFERAALADECGRSRPHAA
jgi:methylated-DNA-[protein]-cysteine S-methyltransferase